MRVPNSCLFGFLDVDSSASDSADDYSQQASAFKGAAALGERHSEHAQCYVTACHETGCRTNGESMTKIDSADS